jgi:hypothetical protein
VITLPSFRTFWAQIEGVANKSASAKNKVFMMFVVFSGRVVSPPVTLLMSLLF